MIWHTLTIILGIIVIIAGIWPNLWSNIILGVLIIIFGYLSLTNFKKLQSK